MGGGLLLLAAACTRTVIVQQSAPGVLASVPADGRGGAVSGRAAVEAFMAGVKAQDLGRMALVWGTAKGPARESLKTEELEKRLIVIQCLLAHNSWQFVEERARLASGGRQDWQVEIRQEQRSARTVFSTVAGPEGRWYVEDLQVGPLQDFCR